MYVLAEVFCGQTRDGADVDADIARSRPGDVNPTFKPTDIEGRAAQGGMRRDVEAEIFQLSDQAGSSVNGVMPSSGIEPCAVTPSVRALSQSTPLWPTWRIGRWFSYNDRSRPTVSHYIDSDAGAVTARFLAGGKDHDRQAGIGASRFASATTTMEATPASCQSCRARKVYRRKFLHGLAPPTRGRCRAGTVSRWPVKQIGRQRQRPNHASPRSVLPVPHR